MKSREDKSRREKEPEERRQKNEDTGARNVRKVAKRCLCLMICRSGDSKSRLAKAAGAESPVQMRN